MPTAAPLANLRGKGTIPSPVGLAGTDRAVKAGGTRFMPASGWRAVALQRSTTDGSKFDEQRW